MKLSGKRTLSPEELWKVPPRKITARDTDGENLVLQFGSDGWVVQSYVTQGYSTT